MKPKIILMAILILLVVHTAAAVTLTPTEDSWVLKAQPSNNYGNSEILYVDGQSEESIPFLKFDLTSINQNIVSAELRLYILDAGNLDAIYLVGDNSWSETSSKIHLKQS